MERRWNFEQKPIQLLHENDVTSGEPITYEYWRWLTWREVEFFCDLMCYVIRVRFAFIIFEDLKFVERAIFNVSFLLHPF